MSRSVTLKDVSKVAGVSTATVARVLHGNGYVAEGTRRRVEEALERTGYRLNILAQGLRRKQSLTIGHLLQGIVPNPFFAYVAMGLEEEALGHGYSTILFNAHGRAELERQGVEMFIERRVDAIVFTTATAAENVRLAAETGVPVVQIERITPVDTMCVTVDHYRGSVAAVEHLIALGHRHIAYIGGDPSLYPYKTSSRRTVEEERLDGYLDTHRRFGLPIEPRLISLGKYYSLENGGVAGEGYQQMRKLLAVDPPPTAVFATCDILAAGALQAIYEQSLHVPDDISVIGFDDTLALHLAPPLTTVALPMREIGRAAARLAINRVRRHTPTKSSHALAAKLVVRMSSAKAPGL